MRYSERPAPGFRRGVVLAWAALLVSCAPAFAAGRGRGLAPDRAQAVERAVQAEMERAKIPGMTVAIGDDLRVAWSRGFGLADVEQDVAATPETVYRIGSISKPITAVAVMQLVERGKLDLDAPIQRYVPSFPEKQWPVTVRALLSHLGGIRHYQSLDEVYSTRHYLDLLEALKIFASEPLVSEPGTSFHYSTFGYSLLGAAVEAASGQRFAEYLKQNILTPAQMEHTRVDDVFTVVPHRARGYRRGAGGTIENCGLFDASNKIPGGGLISTAEDLVHFAIALQKGQLVSAATRARMYTPAQTADGHTLRYGLGWFVVERGGMRWAMHSGSQPGVSTFLLTAPSAGLSVAVLGNLEGVDLGGLSSRIAEIVANSSRVNALNR